MNYTFTDQAKSLWAKKRNNDGQYLWLPLLTHLWDTELMINQLYNHWLSENQRQILSVGLSDEQVQSLVKFIGASHDIGKATAGFQTKPSYSLSESLDYRMIDRLEATGFHGLNDVLIVNRQKSPHAKAGEAILLFHDVPESLGAIIGGHHGRPEPDAPEDDIDVYTSNYWQTDSDAELQALWQAVQQEIFDWCLAISGFQSTQKLPEVTEPQAVILSGLLIMADWLASSESLNNDPSLPLFPLISMDEGFADIAETPRYQHAWQTWHRDLNWHPSIDRHKDPYFERWQFHPRPIQSAVTKAIQAAADPGIMILEAPMGVGKTETALLAAEQLAIKCGQNGLFFGLPTQATTNAMFERVKAWLGTQVQLNEESLSIHLMHGRAIFNQSFQAIPVAKGIDMDEEEAKPAVEVNGWFSGKKTILDEFAIGTIDQLLLLGLKQKHLALRHLGFSKKVVILDEVHASDSYMDQYLFKALEWLGAYHVPIILLSATLPASKRQALVDAYYLGKYGHTLSKQQDPALSTKNWSKTNAYPLLTLLDDAELKQVTQFPGAGDQRSKTLNVIKVAQDDEAVVRQILTDLKGGGIAGVIVNTIDHAQRLNELLRDSIATFVLHSAFLATERNERERQLQAWIGKDGHRPEKLVVIGTQVLEQSLDIDFDVLYTDIAPMDLIMQRAGRLHRHAITRPMGLRQPRLTVIDADELGTYAEQNVRIYPQYLLTRTHWLLPDSLILPNDISRLVQRVYDFKDEPNVADISQQKQTFQDKTIHQQTRANVFRLREPNHKATLHGWLRNGQHSVDKNEQLASVAVRDIEETLEVILLKKTNSVIELLDGRAIDHVTDEQIAQQVIRLPAQITRGQIETAITQLESQTLKWFSDWHASYWLKGSLALLMDDQLHAELLGWQLQYDFETGLKAWKEQGYG